MHSFENNLWAIWTYLQQENGLIHKCDNNQAQTDFQCLWDCFEVFFSFHKISDGNFTSLYFNYDIYLHLVKQLQKLQYTHRINTQNHKQCALIFR